MSVKSIKQLSPEEQEEEDRLYKEGLKTSTCLRNYLGDALKELRVEFAKKTQKQLSDDTGIAQAQISAYERGEYKPDFDVLRKLGVGLSVDPNVIFQLAFDETRFGDKKLIQLPIEKYVQIRTQERINADRELENARIDFKQELVDQKRKELEAILEG